MTYIEAKTTKEMIMESLSILKSEEEVTELRILKTSKGTVSGYFNDNKELAENAEDYDKNVPAIYFTLNPVKSDLLSRAANRVVQRAKLTTADADIDCRRWIPIDFDPVRPAGISSTDDEHQAALTMAKEVQQFLTEKGWCEPIFADSGNGAHLLYPINLPNDDESKERIKTALETLDFLFSNEAVNIDKGVFNAARIWKLYGTMACKGEHTEERPHRLSKIINCPKELKEVSVEQLKALAGLCPTIQTKGKSATKKSNTEAGFNLEEFIERHELDVAFSAPWKDGATKYVLSTCPWNESHTNRSAVIIQFANGGIAARCLHNSCSEENWQTLRKKFEPNWTPSYNKEESKKESQADILIRVSEEAEFFQNDLGEAYAAVTLNGHKEVMKVKNRKFKMWLTKQYFDATKRAPGSDAMNQALGVMEMKAAFEGDEHRLQLRMAEKGGAFYYDLANEDWSVVKIEPNVCHVLNEPPILFTRNKNTKSQVLPDFAGDLNLLLNHIRIKNEDDQILYLTYVVTCLIPSIPHAILVFSGEKGASKSTSMRLTRQVVDPAVQDLLTMPNSMQDLAISLANNYMPSFDNLDGLSAEKSDLLCIASTGGGFSKRTLFTDDDETLLDLRRCVGLTGINVVVTRADLIDRSIIIELDRIPEDERKEERDVWEAFEKDRACIVGGALQTLARAMAIYPNVKLDKLPRMADFTRWGYAIAEVLGYGGNRFLQAYRKNRNQSNEEAISSHPVAATVVALMRNNQTWSGSVSILLSELERVAEQEKINTKVKTFPKAAHILSRRLKEVKSNLEDVGITFDIRHAGDSKKITIQKSGSNVIPIRPQQGTVQRTGTESNIVTDIELSEDYDEFAGW
ncbi:hypothetical protein G3A_02490 [Bacillus sp. 17376]|uniref:Uncharacterized protein n=1 Tax=Mesobacillus boroniphilus JCM 21738 TaxID=1294265 RepID=W4RJK0_9BACI|nr:hypothetical protein [Mesobacillus boroniphilus]ESU34156.1 hypothetical protein G3A_02490 [Bacillus sp. 17376]GAE44053.1 hypothetical protein JCM21738_732 [Mesobacillus boroniphilus JCM 21738]